MLIWPKSEEVSYFCHNSFHTWNILYEIKSLKLREDVRILEMNMTRITRPFGTSCSPANWGSLPFICTTHHKKSHSGLQVTEHGTCFPETMAIDTWFIPSDGSALRCCRAVMSFKKYTTVCFKNYVLVLLWDNRSTLCFPWNDIDCGINYHRLQSSSLKSFICYMKDLHPSSLSGGELWAKFLIVEDFAAFQVPWDRCTDRLEGELKLYEKLM